MRNHYQKRTVFAVAVMAFTMMLPVGATWAQTRTTPVEVKNAPSVSVINSPTVKVDSTANTVQAQQNGPWNVGLPGNPGVTISNIPTVKIDGISNNVVTTAKSASYIPLTSDLAVLPGQDIQIGQSFSCSGYKELRFVFYANSMAATTNLKIRVHFRVSGIPSGYYNAGTANFGTPTHPICEQANFAQPGYTCIFAMPVLGDTCALYVNNGNASTATIYNSSWVYMVN